MFNSTPSTANRFLSNRGLTRLRTALYLMKIETIRREREIEECLAGETAREAVEHRGRQLCECAADVAWLDEALLRIQRELLARKRRRDEDGPFDPPGQTTAADAGFLVPAIPMSERARIAGR